MRDCGNLLTRAGMRLPAVDVDTVTMNYPSPHKLVEHLRVMGETNANVGANTIKPRGIKGQRSTVNGPRSGARGLGPEAAAALAAACEERCRACARCRFISWSWRHGQCSWYHSCELDGLSYKGGGDAHVTVEVRYSRTK